MTVAPAGAPPDFGPTVRVGSEPRPPVPAPAPLPPPVGPDRTRVLVALAVVLGGGALLAVLLYAILKSVFS